MKKQAPAGISIRIGLAAFFLYGLVHTADSGWYAWEGPRACSIWDSVCIKAYAAEDTAETMNRESEYRTEYQTENQTRYQTEYRTEDQTRHQKEEDRKTEHTQSKQAQRGQEETDQEDTGIKDRQPDLQKEAQDLLSDLGLAKIDAYMKQQEFGQLTFSQLVKDLLSSGFTPDFAAVGESLKRAVLADYTENRKVLIQILALAIAFSILMQMTSSIQKSCLSSFGFLGIYIIFMLLLLKLFLLMSSTVESFFSKLVEFMQVLQPVFCMSMVFSTGSMTAGAYYQLLLLLIYFIDTVFAKILLPVVQAYMVLELVNHMMEEQRFLKTAGLLSDSVHWCVKILTTAVIGLNIVQGLLAPGIDGLKRSTIAGAVRIVPGAGQIMNSMTEILAGSAMLIKNSVGVAALVLLVMISFLPLVKIAVLMVLYRGCAALMEPVADKRFCAAVSALGQSAALYLKLMFYAVLLFFLTTAVICAATTLSLSV